MPPNQPFSPYPGPHANPYQQPYAAPAPGAYPGAGGPGMYRENVFVPYGAAAGPLVNPTMRTVKLAMGIVQVVALFGGIGAFILAAVLSDEHGNGGQAPAILGTALLGLWYLLLFGSALMNFVWIYQFWNWFPPEHRYTGMWRKYISPSAAVGFLLIPYFNLYWMFVVNLGIADIMERLRVQYPTSRGPAKPLAIAATVVPLVFFPAAPFIQYFFAKHVEEMAIEMHARRVGMSGPMPGPMMG